MKSFYTRRSLLKTTTGLIASATVLSAPAIVRAQTENKLRIAVGFGLPNLPVRIAANEGFFKAQAEKMGIPNAEVELVQLSGQNPIIDALLSGQIDMCISGPAGMLIAWERTRGTRQEINGYCGLSTNECKLLVVEERLKSLADFKADDKIAMPSTANTQAFLLKMACDTQFDDPGRLDQNMISLPHPDALNGLLHGGFVAAHFASPPYSQVIMADPRARVLLTSREVFGGPSSFVIGAGTRSFAEQQPELVEVFKAGLQDAMKLIASDPSKATDIYLTVEPTNVLSRDQFLEILKDPNEGYSINTLGVTKYAEFMKKVGVLKSEMANINEFMIPASHSLDNN